jgi:hypothetical protein
MGNNLTNIFILILVINFAFASHQNESHSYTMNSSYYSSSEDNGSGKPKTEVVSASTEEYRNQQADKPEEVRKFGELFLGKEDKQSPENNFGVLKQKASTNVEGEAKVLGDGVKISHLDGIQKDVITV